MTIASRSVFWSAALLVFVLLIWVFKSVLLPFVLGATIAYLLNPAVSGMTAKKLNRRTAVLIILGLFTVTVSVILALIVPVLLREASGFIEAAPSYIDKVWAYVQPRLEGLRERLGFAGNGQITDQLQVAVKDNLGKTIGVGRSVIGTLATGLALGGQALAGFVATLLLTPIVAFFMMKDWPTITAWVYELVPPHRRGTVRDLLGKIDVKIAGFIRGQVMVCFILGGMYAIALTLAGLNYGFVIGLSAGLLSIIPYVGSTIGLLTSVVVAALQSDGDMVYVGIIAAIFFAGQFIEGNFITPKLIGESVGLHPLWIIFALLAGGSLLGLLGMFLAVPVAAIISVLVAFAIQQYRTSPYYLTSSDQDLAS
jgi:predicted PurR-regulated permease PerM